MSSHLGWSRRAVLQAALGAGVVLQTPGRASAQAVDPRTQRPQAGDRFAFADGARRGQTITPADLVAGTSPVMVYPVDPASGTVRDGSRLNQILMIRLTDDELAPDTRTGTAEGIVAYSGVCTHAGCDVTLWRAETRRFRCPCHESEFDPRDRGRVVGGPAPRRLPRLPIKIVENALVVDGGFTSRPGF